MLKSQGLRCWICDSNDLNLAKPSNIPERLESKSFSITDSHYGVTGEIHQCNQCGFLQCSDMPDVLPYYEGLEDHAYEAGRAQRGMQSHRLLKVACKYRPNGSLLDIGAGTGILVEQALQMGYRAEGIEPSVWLQSKAAERSLPVHCGTFPHPKVTGPFDVITLIDVIEHVPRPLDLLQQIEKVLSPGGIGIVVTPDIGSLVARLLGWKWWHFRVAHIGYFNRATLNLALRRTELQLLETQRPGWFFTADYLVERINRYLPGKLSFPAVAPLRRIVVPLNLRDSLLMVFARREGDSPVPAYAGK